MASFLWKNFDKFEKFCSQILKQLELLPLAVLTALASNDFAVKLNTLKLLNLMVIVCPCYYEKGVLLQSSELDPDIFLNDPRPPNYTCLVLTA